MKIKIRQLFFKTLFACLAFKLALSIGPVLALTPVNTCGQTLNAPGEYILEQDLVCVDAGGDINGVIITASHVVFHLAGHSISAVACDLTRNISGIFVQGGLTQVKIDGGKINGFNDGIVLASSDSRVHGMTVSNACAFGILAQGSNNLIDTNHVTTSGDGVALVPSSHSRVKANTLSGNRRAGVAISDYADSNTIESNILTNNGVSGEGYGVAVFNGHGNTIKHNAINQNDFGVRIGSAVYRDGTLGLSNIVRENTLNNNAKTGIWLENTVGAPSKIRRNTVLGSGSVDMQDDADNCSGNAWQNNTFITDIVSGSDNGGSGIGCIQ